MQARALILEAHHTTHIEGTHLSLDQSERLIAGEKMSDVFKKHPPFFEEGAQNQELID